MRVKHLAIDGSVVSIDADADLDSSRATVSGWAVCPSLRQPHPCAIYPAGHSAVVEKAVRNIAEITIQEPQQDYSAKGGRLRVAEVRMPAAIGGTRTLTVGAWEGEKGCLTTSLVGSERDRLVEVSTPSTSASAATVWRSTPLSSRDRVSPRSRAVKASRV